MVACSFVTLVLAALALGAPLAHALEMPVRRAYDAALYVEVTHTLYRYFGTVGAAFEVGAIACALIWCGLLWRWPSSLRSVLGSALAGAGCLVLAHVLFWLLVAPVNREFATWTPETVPADWTRFRDQWEFTHTARAGLFLLGFCALLGSVFLARSEAGRTPGRGETTG